MKNNLAYEQPLNERVRAFLRLEYLYKQVEHYSKGTNEWDLRNTITALINIADFLTRSDIKTELIKELERHSTTLNSLANSPAVDNQRLSLILERIDENLRGLKDSTYQPGQNMRHNEFIMSIKQRLSIPGGTCNFDIPGYYFWLHKPHREREIDLENWRSDLRLLNDSIQLSLQMIRNSKTPSNEQAEKGFFQKQLESNVSCQLIRVVLPSDSVYYPEISGGKHRFAIRFMEHQSTSERPVQTSENVSFELHCCIL